LIFVSTIADFFDGFVARLLKVQSDMGKELDSLADMVSFGFVPGTIIYVAFCKSYELNGFVDVVNQQNYIPLFGFLITVFSGIRLAKFNIDTRQSTSFIGLPTPANTLLFLTIPLIWLNPSLNGDLWYETIVTNEIFLISVTLIFSYLLVAELPLIALKFKGFGFQNNVYRYLILAIGITAILLFNFLAIPVILVLYILLSIIETTTSNSN
jgi:CDP-diacylglycerol--serine O-phosphatidyltransferase